VKQKIMEWQWHHLNHMQTICTSLCNRYDFPYDSGLAGVFVWCFVLYLKPVRGVSTGQKSINYLQEFACKLPMFIFLYVAFSAFTLLVWHQEEHESCKS